jgi:hypothetical protein
MPEVPDEHTPEVRRWARRSSDVHAGLAQERLADLSERLRRLSSALQARGEDLTAGAVDDAQPTLSRLYALLESIEGPAHYEQRTEEAGQPSRPSLHARLAEVGNPAPADETEARRRARLLAGLTSHPVLAEPADDGRRFTPGWPIGSS